MLIQHKGKRYAVKITEIESLSENAVDDIELRFLPIDIFFSPIQF